MILFAVQLLRNLLMPFSTTVKHIAIDAGDLWFDTRPLTCGTVSARVRCRCDASSESVAQVLSRGMSPATRYTRRRNTARMVKILMYSYIRLSGVKLLSFRVFFSYIYIVKNCSSFSNLANFSSYNYSLIHPLTIINRRL